MFTLKKRYILVFTFILNKSIAQIYLILKIKYLHIE